MIFFRVNSNKPLVVYDVDDSKAYKYIRGFTSELGLSWSCKSVMMMEWGS